MHILGLNIDKIDALVLSHSHFDHTGGLEAVVKNNFNIPIYAHNHLLDKRYAEIDNVMKFVGISDNDEKLLKQRITILDDMPIEVLPDLWTTGGIINKSEPLGSSPFLYVHNDDGYSPDPYLDDISLVLRTIKGIIIICGCCHAGLLNTLFHVREHFGGPIISVVGGAHLVYSDTEYLDHVIDIISKSFQGTKFYLNHCTGKSALQKFENEFSGFVEYFLAGKMIVFFD